MYYTAHYDSPLGGITLVRDNVALTGLLFDGLEHFGFTLVNDKTLRNRNDESLVKPDFDEIRRWLDIYFSGNEPDFIPSLSLQGTEFQKQVWKALLSIPYGETVTYGELAKRLGVRSAQAVGGALGRNPIAIIVPCHRVTGAHGMLGGYAYGIERKRALLELESL